MLNRHVNVTIFDKFSISVTLNVFLLLIPFYLYNTYKRTQIIYKKEKSPCNT